MANNVLGIPFKLIAAGSTNLTAVANSSGVVRTIFANNQNAAVRYLKLYNKVSTSVTVGTTVPDQTYAIPASGNVNICFVDGLYFDTGISFALTTGVADNDTGAVTANEHVVNISYEAIPGL